MTRLLAALLIVGGMLASASAQPLDERVREVAGELMCPVCEGQTVANSTSLLAQQMRVLIREQLAAGRSREEILAFFVARYGESILAAPPKRGLNLIVWVGPAAILVAGVALAAGTLWRWTRPPAARRGP